MLPVSAFPSQSIWISTGVRFALSGPQSPIQMPLSGWPCPSLSAGCPCPATIPVRASRHANTSDNVFIAAVSYSLLEELSILGRIQARILVVLDTEELVELLAGAPVQVPGHLPLTRVGAGIVDRGLVAERIVVGARETLDQVKLTRANQTVH